MRLGKAVSIATMGMLMETNAGISQSVFTNHKARRLDKGFCEEILFDLHFLENVKTCDDIELHHWMECYEIPCFERGILVRNGLPTSWYEHQEIAADLEPRMQLLEPRTEEINDCLMKNLWDDDSDLHTYRKYKFWLGGFDEHVESKWIWASDEKLFWIGDECGRARGFQAWCSIEPNNWGGDENCLQYCAYENLSDDDEPGGCWNDEPCDKWKGAFYELA